MNDSIVTNTNSSNRTPFYALLLRRRFVFILLALACFALSPFARAVDPPPDGGYPNGNTAEGQDALLNLSPFGIQNTALGFEALFSNTGGDNNTATGYFALHSSTTGSANTATGVWALTADTTGSANTATGVWALYSNTTGNNNTGNGLQALYSNTIGTSNTATGSAALFENTTGSNNTATGSLALVDSTTGNNNTGTGTLALANNFFGSDNTATGYEALSHNSTGISNTATGKNALINNTTGSNNVGEGTSALYYNTTGATNTVCGAQGLYNNTTGNNNIALGNLAGSNLTTGSNNIDIAAIGAAGESNTMRIGKRGVQNNTYIAGIRGTTVPGGVTVMVDSAGHLGTITSSARYKEAIKPMDKASETVLALRPVTFRYKSELDPDGIPQFGLVAEEVERVNPELVARDATGKPYTVRYEAVNAMLLNEFLKEHRKVEEQEHKLAAQESKVEEQEAAINELRSMVKELRSSWKEQAAKIGKVSRLWPVAADETAPLTLVNNQ